MLIKSKCAVTNVVMAATTGFDWWHQLRGNCAVMLHPVLQQPLPVLIGATCRVLECGTDEEHKILLCGLLLKLGLLEVRAPLDIEDKDAPKLLRFLIPMLQDLIMTRTELPIFCIDEDTTAGCLASYLAILPSAMANKPIATKGETQDKLDWELMLEVEINRVLKTGSKYTTKIGKWACDTLHDKRIRGQVTIEEVHCVEYCLDKPADLLRESQLKHAINTCLSHLPCAYELQREDALLVVRFLELKLEALAREQSDFGLVELEEVSGAGSVAGAKYTVVQAKPTQAAPMTVISEAHKVEARRLLAAEGKLTPSLIEVMLRAKKLRDATV